MSKIEQIITELPAYRETAEQVREILLANWALIAEVPAPTFEERARAEMVVERFAAAGLQACAVDGCDNSCALLPGTSGASSILLTAHADTLPGAEEKTHIEIYKDRIVGPFVGDNSLAVAALATLPLLLEKLNIRPRANVIMLAASRSLGRGNHEGLKHFLAENGTSFQSALCMESFQLGRLNYASVGMMRGEIVCSLPHHYDWAQFGSTGSIIPMSDIVNRISRIPVPQRPLTTIILGTILGGIAPGNVARETTLGFEVRSESVEILAQIHEQLQDIVAEVAAQSGKVVTLDIYVRREPGSIDISHPLVKNGKTILSGLGLTPSLYASTSMMSALLDTKIPSLTVGLTTGQRRSELDEIEEDAAIKPIATGMAQLVALVQAMDELGAAG